MCVSSSKINNFIWRETSFFSFPLSSFCHTVELNGNFILFKWHGNMQCSIIFKSSAQSKLNEIDFISLFHVTYEGKGTFISSHICSTGNIHIFIVMQRFQRKSVLENSEQETNVWVWYWICACTQTDIENVLRV